MTWRTVLDSVFVILEVGNSGSVLFQYLLGSKHSTGIIATKYRAGVWLLSLMVTWRKSRMSAQGRLFCPQGRSLVCLVITTCLSPFHTTLWLHTKVSNLRFYILGTSSYAVLMVSEKLHSKSRANVYKCFKGINLDFFLHLGESLPNQSS